MGEHSIRYCSDRIPGCKAGASSDADDGDDGGMNMKIYAGGYMRTILILAITLPAAALVFFLVKDNRSAVRTDIATLPEPAGKHVEAQPVTARQSLPTVEDMLGKLEARLQREPDDAKGWNLLGKSYEYLGRHEDAQKAYDHAKVLGYTEVVSKPAVVRGTVHIDQSVLSDVSATDTVFVFARAVNGPRMPLAVLRKKAGEIPFEFELDDSMAMSPEAKLSGFQSVIVGARISNSGDVTATQGDLEGYSDIVDVEDENDVSITIGLAVIE